MLHIVVPMGGEGKRFAERGYTFPKPLIEIVGKPMVEIIVRNLTPAEPHQFIFVCRESDLRQFALGEVLQLIAPASKVISLGNPTAGALCSVLLGMEYLQNDEELLVANADQYIGVSVDAFLTAARRNGNDGCIVTFPSTHPKWSYVKLEGEEVVRVAEKHPISRDATAGLYYFRRSQDFVDGAEQMLLKNAMFAGEYYLAPVYNELILRGKHIGVFPIAKEDMHSLGSPEDVERFAATVAQTFNW